jgi:hypothetical protein
MRPLVNKDCRAPVWERTASTGVCRASIVKRTTNVVEIVRNYFLCALRKTHGKEGLCRAPDRKRTTNIITHGIHAFSRSDLWYKVVYIGDIGVLLEVFSQWHKRNIWFVHFKIFYFPLVVWLLFSNYKNNFFFQNYFCGTNENFQFFYFPLVVWPVFISKFQK